MPQKISLDLDPSLVRPLGEAQNEFVQVLLSEFEVRSEGHGLTLEVNFDFNTPTIWRRPAKTHIQQQLDPARMEQYREALRGVLLHQTAGGYVHRDSSFPFRFGNGGALPVIRLDRHLAHRQILRWDQLSWDSTMKCLPRRGNLWVI